MARVVGALEVTGGKLSSMMMYTGTKMLNFGTRRRGTIFNKRFCRFLIILFGFLEIVRPKCHRHLQALFVLAEISHYFFTGFHVVCIILSGNLITVYMIINYKNGYYIYGHFGLRTAVSRQPNRDVMSHHASIFMKVFFGS